MDPKLPHTFRSQIRCASLVDPLGRISCRSSRSRSEQTSCRGHATGTMRAGICSECCQLDKDLRDFAKIRRKRKLKNDCLQDVLV